MDERRKAKRIELEGVLNLKRLDGSKAEEISIDIIDVSSIGIGFECKQALTIGAMYEISLTLWTKDVIECCIEIIRIIKEDSTFSYGAMFIGMSEMNKKRIEIYDTVETMTK